MVTVKIHCFQGGTKATIKSDAGIKPLIHAQVLWQCQNLHNIDTIQEGKDLTVHISHKMQKKPLIPTSWDRVSRQAINVALPPSSTP